MKINETIRQRRIERYLTQEQVANYLGVTAPAVNKWEKGTSYPDITNFFKHSIRAAGKRRLFKGL